MNGYFSKYFEKLFYDLPIPLDWFIVSLLLSHYIADRIAPKTQYVVIFVSYNNRRDTHRDGYVKIIAQYVVLIRYKLLHIVVV